MGIMVLRGALCSWFQGFFVCLFSFVSFGFGVLLRSPADGIPGLVDPGEKVKGREGNVCN